MFLKNNDEFNKFTKSLHKICQNDPNYKMPKSWNSFAAKIALALAESSENISNDDFNINTLKKHYNKIENQNQKTFYANHIESLFVGTIREQIANIQLGLNECFYNKDNDLYNFINQKTNGELSESFDITIDRDYSPYEEINKSRTEELAYFISFQDFKTLENYGDTYLTKNDKCKDVTFTNKMISFYSFRETIKDGFYSFLFSLNNEMENNQGFRNIVENGDLNELNVSINKILKERESTILKELF